jgi:NitT/TauT family transport system ATP-binding protein
LKERIVLECKGLHHWFGPKRVLHDINLQIVRGEIVALVGPSGCGKSTLLRAILGTHPPRRGQVIVYHRQDGRNVGKVVDKPSRNCGIVYQHYSLFPHLTAVQNVAFGLMLDETDLPFRFFRFPAWRKLRRRHLEQAEGLLVKLGLGHAVNNYPHELSGGMCQRVAIAQALIMKPDILLLDEPFGALDEATREDLQRMLLRLYAENTKVLAEGREPLYTIMMVTHEINEAIFVSDRVIGLSQYWDWGEKGHREFPGATIVYDQVAPVFLPESERAYHTFHQQKDEILKVTFDPEILQSREAFRGFWQDTQSGRGQGVLQT